jgi:glycosyltransferase involved in cell wall biosynthesis
MLGDGNVWGRESKLMKVLVVSRWLWEERRRNGHKAGFFGELAQAIAARGVDLTLLTQIDGAGGIPERRPVEGLNIHVFSRTGRKPFLAPFDKLIKIWGGYRKAVTDAYVIRRFVRQHGPFDTIVAQCEEPDGLACALAWVLGGMPPLVTMVHDLRYRFRKSGVRFIHKGSLGFVFEKSTRVLANSVPTTTWLHHEYGVPVKKIGQVRIHLTAPFVAEAAQHPTPPDPASRRILFLGALNRKKAPDVYLRAAILLAPELPDATFVLVGGETREEPAFRATIAKLAADPALAGRLEMPGRLNSAGVIEQIRRARVVVCPSLIETFSRTTIEALALGRPVIVTETTGAASWVGSTGAGSIVPPNHPRALADAMRKWATREGPAEFASTVTRELTAARAADDWIREVSAAIPSAKVPDA